MTAGSGSKEATLIAFSAKDHGGDCGDTAPTLRAGVHNRSHANAGVMPAVAYGLRSDLGRDGKAKTPSPDAEGRVRLRDPGFNVLHEQAPTLDAARPHAVACGTLGAGNVRHTAGAKNEADLLIAHSLRANGFDAGEDGTGRGTPLVAHPLRSNVRNNSNPGTEAKMHIRQGMSVRRLTPVECERLQGFPDDYTLVPYRGKPAADGPRYRAIGNSMAVPVVHWIGERIQAFEDATAISEAAE